MYDPVYGGGRGHGIGEHLLPLRKQQVGGDPQGAALISLGNQCEQHLGLLRSLG